MNTPLRQILPGFLGGGIRAPSEATVVERLRVPEGFSLGRFAEGVSNPRFLRFTPAGDLLVSQPREGAILLLQRDADGDGRSDGRRVLIDGLNRPHGLDLHDGWLYVGETDAIARVRFDAAAGTVSGPVERVVTDLPGGGNHWTRTLRFGPDGAMYVQVGSSCNVCLEDDPRRATILRYAPDGSGLEIYATGLRNSVGFDWQPGTGDLYATDNGRDLLGDDFPPCELNRIVRGGFYGWPIANGDRIADPDYGAGNEGRIATSIPPVHAFRAHNAPLGITFVRSLHAPATLRGAALVALHGSWNRTRKDGYRVVSLHWNADGTIDERPFLWGFLEHEDVIGRPVDVAEGPDDAFYVSDDFAGTIYRVSYGEAPRRTAGGMTSASGTGSAPHAKEAIDAAAASRGASLYAKLACANCHDTAHAEPGVVTRPLRGLSLRYDARSLEAFLVAPTPPMPAFPLSADERRDLAAYLLWSRS